LRSLGDDASVLTGPARGLTAALNEASAAGVPITGVVDLTPLDVRFDDLTATDALWADQQRLMSSALGLVQALVESHPSGERPVLWFATRGAQATCAAEPGSPAQASLWGMSHVVALEHPEIHCHRVDLDPSVRFVDALPAFLSELRAAPREKQVALRGDRRLLRRLVRHRPDPASATRTQTIAADKTYLVTGGLRGLGLLVAEWLVDQGARSLVLMGRRAPEGPAIDALGRLTSRGATVITAAGDVSREEDVRRVIDDIARTMRPLGGIVHAAGVLDDGVLAAQTWERFATVMAPKVLGAWHLHRLAPPVDFFVLFSSGAAIGGSAGQANHAAANAFEDALAWYRQAHGLPTVSINWGPWAEVGAAADRRVSGPSFLRQIAPGDGLLALEACLRRDITSGRLARAQLAVLAADWSQTASTRSALLSSDLFRELAPSVRTAGGPAAARTGTAAGTLRDRLRDTAPNRRRGALNEHVRMLTVKVLGLEDPGTLDIHEPLRQLGLDSLMAVELRNLLATAVGRTLPATITFDHPTVSALAEFLAADALADELVSVAAPVAVVPVAPDAVEPDDLSLDELAARLTQRLDRMTF
jgi:NAD(P)-dependent dehydrogenase (short-subunit alcohol dehydrogenase family)